MAPPLTQAGLRPWGPERPERPERDPGDREVHPNLTGEFSAALAAWHALTPAAMPSDACHSCRRSSGSLPIAPRLDMSVATVLGAHDATCRKKSIKAAGLQRAKGETAGALRMRPCAWPRLHMCR